MLDLTYVQAARWSELSHSDTLGTGFCFSFFLFLPKHKLVGAAERATSYRIHFVLMLFVLTAKKHCFKITFRKRLHCEAVPGY